MSQRSYLVPKIIMQIRARVQNMYIVSKTRTQTEVCVCVSDTRLGAQTVGIKLIKGAIRSLQLTNWQLRHTSPHRGGITAIL